VLDRLTSSGHPGEGVPHPSRDGQDEPKRHFGAQQLRPAPDFVPIDGSGLRGVCSMGRHSITFSLWVSMLKVKWF
jgi:hypothetical protein